MHPESRNPGDPGQAGATMADQRRAIALSLTIDLIIFLPAAAVALLSGSMLLLSDLLDYCNGIAANAVSLSILKRIERGRTSEFDFGAGKLEVVGGMLAGLMILGGLLATATFATWRLFFPKPLDTGFTLLGVLLNAGQAAIYAWLWRRNLKLAKRSRSPIMEAQWRTNRSDAFASLAVLGALALGLLLRHHSWAVYLDSICALLFIAMAAMAFMPMFRSTLGDLLDKTLDEAAQMKILQRLAEHHASYETFKGVHSRSAGSRIFVDILLGFHPDKRVAEVMDTVQRLCEGVAQDIPGSVVQVVLVDGHHLAPERQEAFDHLDNPFSRIS